MADDKHPLSPAVENARDQIAAKLDALSIPYAVIGSLALAHHGYRRFTEDVDIVVRPQDLKEIHRELVGRGYMRPFSGSKNLKDTVNNVKIDILKAGDYPGDGLPKPVAFPDPSCSPRQPGTIKVIPLATLTELKLASGMTAPDRIRDLADVQELIRTLVLPRGFADELDEYVRQRFTELWDATFGKPKRYVTLWRNKWISADALTIDDMAAALERAAQLLRAMQADGIELDPHGGTADDYAYLFTSDPAIAKKYDMHDEEEFFGYEDDADTQDAGEAHPG